MKNIHTLTLAVAVFAAVSAHAEEPIRRTSLLKSEISKPGLEIVQVRVDFAPGALASKHSHPGEEIAYVLQGALEYKLEGQKPVVLIAGQSLFIPTGVVHSARNVGGATATELATYVASKGKALVVPFE